MWMVSVIFFLFMFLGQSKFSTSKKNVSSFPCGQTFLFSGVKLNKNSFATAGIEIKALHYSFLSQELIGQYSFAYDRVYGNKQHTIVRQFIALTQPDKPSEPRGFLKISVGVYGIGDRVPSLDEFEEEPVQSGNMLDRLLKTPELKLQYYQLSLNIFEGLDICPSLEQSQQEQLCFFMRVKFLGVTLMTSTFNDFKKSKLHQTLQIPCVVPCMENEIFLEFWRAPVGTSTSLSPSAALPSNAQLTAFHRLSFSDLTDAKHTPPFWISLYGPQPTVNSDTFFSNLIASIKGPDSSLVKEFSTFVGRFLVSASVLRVTEPVASVIPAKALATNPNEMEFSVISDLYEISGLPKSESSNETFSLVMSLGAKTVEIPLLSESDDFSKSNKLTKTGGTIKRPTGSSSKTNSTAFTFSDEGGRIQPLSVFGPSSEQCPNFMVSLYKMTTNWLGAESWELLAFRGLSLSKFRHLAEDDNKPFWLTLKDIKEESSGNSGNVSQHDNGLKAGRSKTQCKVLFSAFCDLVAENIPRRPRVEYIQRTFAFRAYIHQVTNLSLLSGDKFLNSKGLADPCVRISLGGRQIITKRVPMSLNPAFFQAFDIRLELPTNLYLIPDMVIEVIDGSMDSEAHELDLALADEADDEVVREEMEFALVDAPVLARVSIPLRKLPSSWSGDPAWFPLESCVNSLVDKDCCPNLLGAFELIPAHLLKDDNEDSEEQDLNGDEDLIYGEEENQNDHTFYSDLTPKTKLAEVEIFVIGARIWDFAFSHKLSNPSVEIAFGRLSSSKSMTTLYAEEAADAAMNGTIPRASRESDFELDPPLWTGLTKSAPNGSHGRYDFFKNLRCRLPLYKKASCAQNFLEVNLLDSKSGGKIDDIEEVACGIMHLTPFIPWLQHKHFEQVVTLHQPKYHNCIPNLTARNQTHTDQNENEQNLKKLTKAKERSQRGDITARSDRSVGTKRMMTDDDDEAENNSNNINMTAAKILASIGESSSYGSSATKKRGDADLQNSNGLPKKLSRQANELLQQLPWLQTADNEDDLNDRLFFDDKFLMGPMAVMEAQQLDKQQVSKMIVSMQQNNHDDHQQQPLEMKKSTTKQAEDSAFLSFDFGNSNEMESNIPKNEIKNDVGEELPISLVSSLKNSWGIQNAFTAQDDDNMTNSEDALVAAALDRPEIDNSLEDIWDESELPYLRVPLFGNCPDAADELRIIGCVKLVCRVVEVEAVNQELEAMGNQEAFIKKAIKKINKDADEHGIVHKVSDKYTLFEQESINYLRDLLLEAQHVVMRAYVLSAHGVVLPSSLSQQPNPYFAITAGDPQNPASDESDIQASLLCLQDDFRSSRLQGASNSLRDLTLAASGGVKELNDIDEEQQLLDSDNETKTREIVKSNRRRKSITDRSDIAESMRSQLQEKQKNEKGKNKKINGIDISMDEALNILKDRLGVELRHQHLDGSSVKIGKMNPEFNKCYQIDCTLPSRGFVTISLMNSSSGTKNISLVSDKLIGQVIIDIEDRIMHPNFALLVRQSGGGNSLFDHSNSYDTTTSSALIPHNSVARRGIPTLPIENFGLVVPGANSPLCPGTLRMFFEIMTPFQSRLSPPLPLANRDAESFELRIVVWRLKGIPVSEGESSVSLLVKALVPPATSDSNFSGDVMQESETDTHWYSDDGSAVYNWRMVFPVTLPANIPTITFQVWNHNLLSSNDALAEATIDLSSDYNSARKFRKTVNISKSWIPLALPANPEEPRGAIEVQIDIVPSNLANTLPVGKGREEPNRDPILSMVTENRDYIGGSALAKTAVAIADEIGERTKQMMRIYIYLGIAAIIVTLLWLYKQIERS